MRALVLAAFALIATVSVSAQNGSDAPMSTKTADEAVNAMRVSSACADAAEKAWHIGGYDKPSGDTVFAHSSHYNRELKRCLILITDTTFDTKAGTWT
jgi:hypothetical protein